ncbi:MAG: hypothetical protein H0V82_06565 [Candidatus Protochlamydia sp.]|nr:hypothetical protein [Candidatus Protochlamydia sp.]
MKKENLVTSLAKIKNCGQLDRKCPDECAELESVKDPMTIELMAKHIAQLKRPPPHSFSNPLNGNSLY